VLLLFVEIDEIKKEIKRCSECEYFVYAVGAFSVIYKYYWYVKLKIWFSQ